MSIERKSLRTATDLYQIKEATKRNCIFISLDHDFHTNESLIGAIRQSPGVILIYTSDFRPENITRIMRKHLNSLSENMLLNKICRLSIDKIEYIEI